MENKNYDNVVEKKANNTFMIFLLVAIIFISELFLFNYLQASIASDISVNYVAKNDLEGMFRDILISDEDFRSILRVLVREDSSDNFNRRKRGALVVDDDNMVTSQTYPGAKESQTVEFFNPKLRHELEAKDEVERSRTGNKGSAPGGDSWVWLTSYCRIPLMAIEGYCLATKEYCPTSPQGPPGLPGVSGPKGDRGDTGLPGIPGPAGIRGPRGPPGEVGWPGSPGLDGRDGVPGEPGLDGVPGRSGLDGIPGMNGLPGQDGRPGSNGINGTDGKPGLRGPQGPPGPKGERGNYGPKGRAGRPGLNGTPGNPGISTYKVPGRNLSELLIPPSIAGSKTVLGNRPIVVHEGENVRMRCAATGVPKPAVEWRKADGSAIPLGSWQTVSVSGYYLNLTRVNRGHMGTYQCVADNGIGPAANQTFRLEVHFPPLIRIRNQMVGAANTTTAVLECEVEAFPEAVRYWERSDGRLLEHSSKYRVDNSFERDGYKAVMQLRIVNVSGPDFMRYHCIAKNEHGITRGEFTLYEVDPRLVTPPPVVEGSGVAIYGVQPPESKSLDDLCPPPIQCPECPDPKELKCPNPGVSYFDLMGKLVVRPFGNDTYPGIPNRATDCVLYAVGKPVYHRFTEQTYGCWMRDPLPPTEAASEKFWVTRENSSYYLYEFENKAMFRKDSPTKRYVLEHQFRGNSHVIFNGSFFYNKRDHPIIMKFDLVTERYHSLKVPMVATNGTNFLYTTEYNYMDFNVDDNGLWVIYGIPTSNNTVVMKVDANQMTIQYMWNISINHHKVGEMFIVCGVLYGVDSITDRNTKIRMALDLYKNSPIDVNLSFTNPFRKSTMIGYNFRTKELYTWDKGNQLTYPIRYHEMGYNMSKEEKQENADFLNAQMHTGVDIYN